MKTGDYHLLKQLSSDADSVCYLAETGDGQPPLELRVFKLVTNENVLWDRFVKRPRIIRLVEHPSVKRLVALQEAHQPPFVVVEYRDDRSLREVVARRTPLPGPDAVTLVAQLTAALAATHQLGVGHGGVSPETVYVADGINLQIDLTTCVPKVQSAVLRSRMVKIFRRILSQGELLTCDDSHWPISAA